MLSMLSSLPRVEFSYFLLKLYPPECKSHLFFHILDSINFVASEAVESIHHQIYSMFESGAVCSEITSIATLLLILN